MKPDCTTEGEHWAHVPSITRIIPSSYPLASQEGSTAITAVFFSPEVILSVNTIKGITEKLKHLLH